MIVKATVETAARDTLRSVSSSLTVCESAGMKRAIVCRPNIRAGSRPDRARASQRHGSRCIRAWRPSQAGRRAIRCLKGMALT